MRIYLQLLLQRLPRQPAMHLLAAGLLLGFLPGAAGAEFNGDYHDEDSGYIERLDFASGTAVIGGLSYRMAPVVAVEINDTYGAFTLLKRGMFVRVLFLEEIDNDRQAVFIEELTNPADREET